jgi:hypothetical protein
VVSCPPDSGRAVALRAHSTAPSRAGQLSLVLELRERAGLAGGAPVFPCCSLCSGYWPALWARSTVRKACASMQSVICRYQPCQKRTSYSSNPTSLLPTSKQCSTVQLAPITARWSLSGQTPARRSARAARLQQEYCAGSPASAHSLLARDCQPFLSSTELSNPRR